MATASSPRSLEAYDTPTAWGIWSPTGMTEGDTFTPSGYKLPSSLPDQKRNSLHSGAPLQMRAVSSLNPGITQSPSVRARAGPSWLASLTMLGGEGSITP